MKYARLILVLFFFGCSAEKVNPTPSEEDLIRVKGYLSEEATSYTLYAEPAKQRAGTDSLSIKIEKNDAASVTRLEGMEEYATVLIDSTVQLSVTLEGKMYKTQARALTPDHFTLQAPELGDRMREILEKLGDVIYVDPFFVMETPFEKCVNQCSDDCAPLCGDAVQAKTAAIGQCVRFGLEFPQCQAALLQSNQARVAAGACLSECTLACPAGGGVLRTREQVLTDAEKKCLFEPRN